MLRDRVISAGFTAFAFSGLHRALARYTRGRGVILMFHHVRPWTGDGFAPNRLLEITPEFLDIVLGEVKAAGFEIQSMDAALTSLAQSPGRATAPFAVLSFDDGYRDNVEFALPVLERHKAPFIQYVTTGFADRSTSLWWRDLEAALRALPQLEGEASRLGNGQTNQTEAEKSRNFDAIYWKLRQTGEVNLRAAIRALAASAGVDPAAITEALCMDWAAICDLARHPLCTIGVHTRTHPMLAQIDAQEARSEMAQSRAEIESRIGSPARHLSYPVGDPTSAGAREFAMARELGFASAVTTRPGMILSAHQNRLHALPRLSINGKWQQASYVNVLLSGAPFALINRFQPA
ncbi:MAG: polysaccharide deacetylase family protein [Hyphomicrobiales bacterium]|nr:polysaccharide deacetylase family protein [Hyphomicrobiales bacterium]MDE2113948.1 polysaccharide deacetylase family protein [Hyphomicrobiales bacterium]